MNEAQNLGAPAAPEIAEPAVNPVAPPHTHDGHGVDGVLQSDAAASPSPPAGEGTGLEPGAIAQLYQELHARCGGILNASLEAEFCQLHAASHVFLHELESWVKAIAPNREEHLFAIAAREYQCALLALAQGHYRQAFKGLRLVLELCLQAIHLSTHRVELQEWLESRKDTVWGVLMDEENGVLSLRYARAFFSELVDDVRHHRSLAEQLYRECSECVHGTVERYIPLPKSLAFTPDAFRLWHRKAAHVALVVAFALVLRYLKELQADTAKSLEHDILDRLGHIAGVRRFFGGPEGG